MMAPERVARVDRPEGCAVELRVYNPSARRTIVLTNGLGCGDGHFRYLLDDLARDHRVVTWDMRGQGASTSATGPGAYAIGALAGDLAAVQSAAGAASAAHLGFGIGAVVALEHHAWSADAVDALVLVQGGLPLRGGRLPLRAAASRALLGAAAPIAAALAPAVAGRRTRRRALRAARAWGLVGPTLGLDDFATLVAESAAQSPRRQLALLRAALGHRPVDPLARVKVPTLVVAAERDPFYPEPLARRVHASLHNTELVRIPGAGHSCLLEVGPLVAARVRRFLAERQAQRPW
jgi:pimeloyl-ACP methyl ester carboxylesterase